MSRIVRRIVAFAIRCIALLFVMAIGSVFLMLFLFWAAWAVGSGICDGIRRLWRSAGQRGRYAG
jgi:hypothetical protein